MQMAAKNKIKYSFFILTLFFNACSLKTNEDVFVDKTYIVVKIQVTNGELSFCSHNVKINLFYNPKKLWYIKNENTFQLEYREPKVTLTEKGLQINFGLLPSTYFGSTGVIELYFLPIDKGDVQISGETLYKKEEFYYGPRHKTKKKIIPKINVFISNYFEAKSNKSTQFFEFLKKISLYDSYDYLKGDETKIYIPVNISKDAAEKHLVEVFSEKGFRESDRVNFPGGVSYMFHRVKNKEHEIIEARATIEDSEWGTHLHLFAFGNVRVDALFDSLDSHYRNLIAE